MAVLNSRQRRPSPAAALAQPAPVAGAAYDWDAAHEALESMDDCARVAAAVAPIGPYALLRDLLTKAKEWERAALAQPAPVAGVSDVAIAEIADSILTDDPVAWQQRFARKVLAQWGAQADGAAHPPTEGAAHG